MSTFNLNLLDSYRSPKPKPEAPVGDAAPKEGSVCGSPAAEPESDNTCVTWTWATVVKLLDTSKMTCPDLKQELLEDIETWLHEWDVLETNIPQKMVKDWKVAAEKLMEESCIAREVGKKGKGKKKETDANMDMEKLKLGGCMSAKKTNNLKCECCTLRKISCMEGCTSHYVPCNKLHIVCSFAAKCKAAGTAGPTCKVACIAGGCAATGLTSVDNAKPTVKSEVEVEEIAPLAPEQPAHPKIHLPVCPVAGGSQVDDKGELVQLHAEGAHLTEENTHLCASQEEYAQFVQNTHQQAQAQQIKFVAMSNKLYTWADDWRDMGWEMEDFVILLQEHLDAWAPTIFLLILLVSALASHPYPDLTLVILVILAIPFALYLSLQQSQYIWPDPFADEAYPCSVPPPD
ncbi:uncharacterized protein EDB93DRAFT_1255947 [Suillus bovinus]|uniref:uncharacterized protein n=1 Tax=Suillus bovinus TaxID=48563 RepID=UPI001B87CA25|nr:uncharacterized protein EDB93DRAFT_1255947 [Suillus bovinus]KAG2130326.1 hypothetical protein EDB93DRAFT_1255947 [Suillus bovinus]